MMGYSFSPHLKRKKPSLRRFIKTLTWPKIELSKVRKGLKNLVLADFDLPPFFLTHIHLVVFKAKLKRFSREFPYKANLFSRRVAAEIGRRKRMIALTILVLSLGGSVGYGMLKKWEREEKLHTYQEIKSLESKIEEAENVAKLNPLKAKSLIEQLDKEIALSEQKLGAGWVLGLKTRFNEFRTHNFRLLSDQDFPVVYDFKFLKEKEFGTTLISQNNSLVVADKHTGSAYRLNYASKTVETLIENSPELKNLIDASAYKNRLFFLTKDGIYELLGVTLKKIIENNNWVAPLELDTYQGNNLYVLDLSPGVIWKYQEAVKGWSEGKSYLVDKSLDLKSASSLSVDGNVWLSFEDGGVVKLLRGKREDFSLSGLETPFGKNNLIYTSEELGSLYILDRSNDRFLIFNKLGNFVKQYNNSLFGTTLSFVVNEAEKKIYFLKDQKIVSLEIK